MIVYFPHELREVTEVREGIKINSIYFMKWNQRLLVCKRKNKQTTKPVQI